jgi:hypothetical protein
LLTNLNLPPWLAIKATHMIMSCIIPGECLILYEMQLSLNLFSRSGF